VWHLLDNGMLETAVFTAERLHAFDPKSADAAHLLALCLIRDAQYRRAEVLTKKWLKHVGCAYIFAQCCLKLGDGREKQGISALETCKRHWISLTAWSEYFLPLGAVLGAWISPVPSPAPHRSSFSVVTYSD